MAPLVALAILGQAGPGAAVAMPTGAPSPSLAATAPIPAGSDSPTTTATTMAPSPLPRPVEAPLGDAAAQTTASLGNPSDPSDIVVLARPGPVPVDPMQAINEQSYKATQVVDRAITRPAAMAYQKTLPSPVRDGLRNFFLNLHEIDIFLNFMVQLKPGKAFETAGRFAINTTAGAAGLFDIAKRKPFRLPRRPNSFGDTLGFYGVGSGPFFYLPLIGPTTLRDLVGRGVDGLVLPTLVGKPFTGLTYTLPSTVVRSLDRRAEADDRLARLSADPNPYAATRADYLQRRQAEIDHLRGRDRVNAPADQPH